MILYFSGTGNSRFVAENLGNLLKDEVVSIGTYLRTGKKGEFQSESPYVIVAPSYMSRIPMRVEEFLSNATLKGNKNIYFVMTAGQAIGNAGNYCKKIYEKHQMNYKGVQAVAMPANYIVMYDVVDRENAAAEAKKALPSIEKIAGIISAEMELKNDGLNGHKMFSVIAPAFTSMMVKAKRFYAEDSCIGCGKCKELCPLGNISLKNKKPVWGDSCMHCMACISACPPRAIQYGKGTKNKNRYYLEK